jgi:anti-sigma B factor antagonist
VSGTTRKDDEEGIAVAVDHEPGAEHAHVRVEGEVDTASVGTLAAALERLVANGVTDLRLDLGHVAFMDSTGLSALITARTLLGGRGTVTVESASSAVRRTFEVAGLDVVFGTA